MKKLCISFTFLFMQLFCLSQSKDTVYLDYHSKKTNNLSNWVYFQVREEQNNICSFTDYNNKNEIIRKGFLKKKPWQVPIGLYSFYHQGKLIYKGNYSEGQKAGWWYFYDTDSRYPDSLYYEDDYVYASHTTSSVRPFINFLNSDAFFSKASDNQQSLHLDYYFQETSDTAYLYTRVMQKKENIWFYTDYDRKNNKVQTGFLKDSFQYNPDGLNTLYQNGKLIAKGYYTDGVESGWWHFYDRSIFNYDSLYMGNRPDSKASTTALPEQPNLSPGQNSGEVKSYPPPQMPPPSAQPIIKNTNRSKDESATSVMNEDRIYSTVTTQAQFPGGLSEWLKYLRNAIQPPDTDMLPGLAEREIKLKIRFIIDVDGSVRDIHTLNTHYPFLDMKAIRVIRNSPKWIPAETNGKKIKYHHMQPVTYYFEDE